MAKVRVPKKHRPPMERHGVLHNYWGDCFRVAGQYRYAKKGEPYWDWGVNTIDRASIDHCLFKHVILEEVK